MNTKKAARRILTTALSLILMLGGMTQIFMADVGYRTAPGGEITAFAPLPGETAYQTVHLGTSFSELDLPQTLEAEIDGADSKAPVTWASRPDYDGDTEDTYPLTAAVDGDYSLAAGVCAPEILVRVGEQPVGIMAAAFSNYNPNDIAVINRIIDTNGLGWTKFTSNLSAPPSDWNIGWRTDVANGLFEVENLHLDSESLSGVLDVTGLHSLELLDCQDNELTGLVAAGLTNLGAVKCNNNKTDKIGYYRIAKYRGTVLQWEQPHNAGCE